MAGHSPVFVFVRKGLGLVMTLDAPDHLERMLTRLKLTAIRDQLDSLLDEAARAQKRTSLTSSGSGSKGPSRNNSQA